MVRYVIGSGPSDVASALPLRSLLYELKGENGGGEPAPSVPYDGACECAACRSGIVGPAGVYVRGWVSYVRESVD
jgi:hypothetical protein